MTQNFDKSITFIDYYYKLMQYTKHYVLYRNSWEFKAVKYISMVLEGRVKWDWGIDIEDRK